VVTACEPLSFLFYPFPVSHGTQIHECCMKFRNDLIVHCTLFLEKKSKSGSRVPWYSRARPSLSWHLVIMILIQR
jgi:hypothetical protein